MSVPTRSGRTPKLAGSKSGAQFVPVKKSIGLTVRKNSIAGKSSETTIPTVVTIEISAQSASRTWISFSP